jgi:hypothetical protein
MIADGEIALIDYYVKIKGSCVCNTFSWLIISRVAVFCEFSNKISSSGKGLILFISLFIYL